MSEDKLLNHHENSPILIHVGLHKCGSTWLQKHMFNNEEIGFSSPWGEQAALCVSEIISIDPLTFCPSATLEKFNKNAKIGKRDSYRVISHEALSSRPHHGSYYSKEVAQRLYEIFPNAKVLFIFREQGSLIHSLYGEHLRNGGRETLREFIGTGFEPDGFTSLIRLSFFEFERLLQLYQDIFGEANTLALPLEMLSKQPNMFVKKICDFCNVPQGHLPTSRRENIAWGPVTYELLRCSNYVFRGSRLKPKTGPILAVRRKVLEIVDRLIPKKLQVGFLKRQQAVIKQRTGNRYCQSNLKLSRSLELDLRSYGYDC